MPTRDEQEWHRKRQQIIDGALEVFSSKGFEKATNKDIADAAGVRSPGLIYHYFKDKNDLFRHVLERHAPSLQLLSHSDELMDRPPRAVLLLLGNAFITTLSSGTTVALFKLMLGSRSGGQPSRRWLTRLDQCAASSFSRATLSTRWTRVSSGEWIHVRQLAVSSAP